MRRPLFLGGLLFSVTLWLFLQIFPLWWGNRVALPEGEVHVEGTICQKEYRLQGQEIVLVVYLKQCRFEGFTKNINPRLKLLCYVPVSEDNKKNEAFLPKHTWQEDSYRIGNRVVLRGKLQAFSNATNQGEFDQKKYYQILDVLGSLKKVVLLDAQQNTSPWKLQWNFFREKMFWIKTSGTQLFYRLLPEDKASIMCSLLLGENAILDRDTKSLYGQSGIIHILAISGLHISMIGMGFFQLLRKMKLSIFASSFFAFMLVFFYAVLIGFGPSSFRAIVMFIFQMVALLLGRTYDVQTGLLFAAVLILVMQPLYLFHSGFLFSFLAVYSLQFFSGFCQTIFPSRLSPGIAVFLGTLPVHSIFYNQFAVYSLFLNLLIIPLVPILLLGGILLQMVGFLSLQTAKIVAIGINLLLIGLEKISQLSMSLPYKHWVIATPKFAQVILYLTILVIIGFFYVHFPKTWNILWICVAIGLLTRNWQSGLQITYLDVGQGDGIYVTDHRNTNVLIDGGSTTKKNVGKYQMLPFLKSQGVSYLDAVFLSHLDEDHVNGMMELIEYSDEDGPGIGVVYIPSVEDSEKYQELVTLTESHRIPIKVIGAGDIYQKGDVKLSCLYPEKRESELEMAPVLEDLGTDLDSNEHSMVLFLENKGFGALFTGDLEGQGEQTFLEEWEAREAREGPIKVDILKVAHHGSRNATSAIFLETIKPKFAVISVAKNSPYGHPHEETIERLEEHAVTIFRTDQGGMITVCKRGKKIRIQKFFSVR